MESFASRKRWISMKAEMVLGQRGRASKLEVSLEGFLSAWYWISLWNPTSKPETTSWQSKFCEDCVCKTLPLVWSFCRWNEGSVTAGAATFSTNKARKQKSCCSIVGTQDAGCGRFCQNWTGIPDYTFHYSKKRRKNDNWVKLNTAAYNKLARCQQPTKPWGWESEVLFQRPTYWPIHFLL